MTDDVPNDPTNGPTDRPGFDVGDVKQLAQRAVDTFLLLVRRAMAFGGGVLVICAFCCIAGFLLGMAALSGGIRSVWIVLGGAFMVLAIGAVIVGMWRLRSIRKGADALVGEVTKLISGDQRAEQVVIETVESTEGVQDQSVVVMSRQFYGFQQAVGDRRAQFTEVTKALRAITTFPGLIVLATLISMIFAGLGLLFLIALAL